VIRVYATNKLRRKLPLGENNVLPAGRPVQAPLVHNPLNGWHAHLLTLQRRQCVLFVHNHSRFALLIPCLKKPEFASLDWHFEDVLMNTLLKVGMPEHVLNRAANCIAPLCFDHEFDRSVMGTLNQLAADIEHQLWYEGKSVRDLLPYRTSAWLSERPCHVKGQKDCIWPIDSMRAVLDRTLH
jgi:hypothetical protein